MARSTVPPLLALGRALLRRCPRCGGGRLFARWWTMKDRCPRCGLHFEREEGFFLGAWVMNYAAASAVVGIVLAVVIAIEANDPGANLAPVLVVGGVATIVTPLVAYPWSRTLWVAIELIMRPLDPREVADADQAQAAKDAAEAAAAEASAAPAAKDPEAPEAPAAAAEDSERSTDGGDGPGAG